MGYGLVPWTPKSFSPWQEAKDPIYLQERQVAKLQRAVIARNSGDAQEMLGIWGLVVTSCWKHDLDVCFIGYCYDLRDFRWIADDFGYVSWMLLEMFDPPRWVFVCLAVDAVNPRWANVCLISRSTAKNTENNNEMLEGSTRDLFDDAGRGLNEFRILSV